MRRLTTLTMALALLMSAFALKAATNVYKCTINGVVTYQSDPCPTGEPGKQPTIEQLNAERQRKLKQASDGAANPSGAPQDSPRQPNLTTATPAQSDTERAKPTVGPKEPAGMSFKCDGRQYCSQMTSCAEAKYFLAQCPGAKMDGDKNGVPCEKQWCNW